MPERWESVQSVTEQENLVLRVYPQSIEVYPRRMKREEESWRLSIPGLTHRSSLGPREGRARELEI